MKIPENRSHIDTEKRNEHSMDLHKSSVGECLAILHESDKAVHQAISKVMPSIEDFINSLVLKFKNGGRLIYLGAGTSGRLGVLDASEIPPTFQFEEGRIIGIIAGGDGSLRKSSEGKEDERQGAIDELKKLVLNKNDCVFGIAAGGTTPFVHGALEYAKSIDSELLTGFLSCSEIKKAAYIDHLIVLKTGAEVVTGSTRMKAGTATKMVLNMVSTTLMIQVGRVYENLMVDLRASNEKLVDRAIRILTSISGESRESCYSVLQQAGLQVKTAVVMLKKKVSKEDAESLLQKSGGRIDFLDESNQ